MVGNVDAFPVCGPVRASGGTCLVYSTGELLLNLIPPTASSLSVRASASGTTAGLLQLIELHSSAQSELSANSGPALEIVVD